VYFSLNTLIKIPKDTIHQECLEKWEFFINSGQFQKAIEIDLYHYSFLVKPNEDKEYWDKWQIDTLNLRQKICAHFTEKRPDYTINKVKNKFLIIHHNFSGLAHETQLSRNINYIKKIEGNIEFDVVYLFGPEDRNLEAAEKIYGINKSCIYFLNAKSYVEAGALLDIFSKNNEYKTLIYPSIFFMAYWISIFVRHPNQKFLTLKYFPLQTGRIKEWACIRRTEDFFIEIKNNKFTQLSLLDLNVEKTTLKHNERSSKSLTFGSISRKEKTTDNEYNKFIESKINNYSNLSYLYTERGNDKSSIPAKLQRNLRVKNLGWVNPAEAIGKFSIYLEPFPWGGGDMSFLAVSNGNPYLTLDTEENRTVGLYSTLELISRGGGDILKYSFCSSIENLSEVFDKLITDNDFRSTMGIEWKKAAANYDPINPIQWKNFLMS